VREQVERDAAAQVGHAFGDVSPQLVQEHAVNEEERRRSVAGVGVGNVAERRRGSVEALSSSRRPRVLPVIDVLRTMSFRSGGNNYPGGKRRGVRPSWFPTQSASIELVSWAPEAAQRSRFRLPHWRRRAALRDASGRRRPTRVHRAPDDLRGRQDREQRDGARSDEGDITYAHGIERYACRDSRRERAFALALIR